MRPPIVVSRNSVPPAQMDVFNVVVGQITAHVQANVTNSAALAPNRVLEAINLPTSQYGVYVAEGLAIGLHAAEDTYTLSTNNVDSAWSVTTESAEWGSSARVLGFEIQTEGGLGFSGSDTIIHRSWSFQRGNVAWVIRIDMNSRGIMTLTSGPEAEFLAGYVTASFDSIVVFGNL